ncbi:MAG TPA: hypothetical protein VMX35_12585 [Acidobacteriota bacterium]|nr:hypothetical protein [Acidobacteriota bacterium]
MKRAAVTISIVMVLTLAGCAGEAQYDNAEGFLRAFVTTLANGDLQNCESFYLSTTDFDPSIPGAQPAIGRFDTTIRQRFLNSCRGAMELLKGKEVEILAIELHQGEQRVATFMKNVGEHYAMVNVRVKAEGTSISLLIEEVIKTDGNWRLTSFSTLVDTGTEQLPDIEIRPSTEERDTEDLFEEDEEGDSQPSTSR